MFGACRVLLWLRVVRRVSPFFAVSRRPVAVTAHNRAVAVAPAVEKRAPPQKKNKRTGRLIYAALLGARLLAGRGLIGDGAVSVDFREKNLNFSEKCARKIKTTARPFIASFSFGTPRRSVISVRKCALKVI